MDVQGMKCLWLEQQKLFFKEKVPIPVLKEGQALIQILLAGICNTDI